MLSLLVVSPCEKSGQFQVSPGSAFTAQEGYIFLPGLLFIIFSYFGSFMVAWGFGVGVLCWVFGVRVFS